MNPMFAMFTPALGVFRSPLGRYVLIGFTAVSLILGFRSHWIAIGIKHERAAESARAAKAATSIAKHEARATRITQAAASGLVKAKTIIEYRTRTLIKEVPHYVTPEADAACVVPVGPVRLLDAAAGGEPPIVPEPAGGPLNAPSGFALSDLTSSVVENYGLALSWRAEAQAWREWYVQQRSAWK